MQRNALEQKQSVFRVETLKSAYRNIVTNRLDPILVKNNGDSVIPEHNYFTRLLSNIEVITHAVKDISKQSTFFTKVSSVISWGSSLRESKKEIKNNINELQSSVNLSRLIVCLESLIHFLQENTVKMLDFSDQAIDFTLRNKGVISEAMDELTILMDEVKDKEWMTVYHHINGLSGLFVAIDTLKKNMPKLHQIKTPIMDFIAKLNQKIKEVILVIDEIEIIFGLEEGAIIEIINDAINFYRKQDKERLTVESIFSDLQNVLGVAGYEFDEENNFPFFSAILNQRRLLYKWHSFYNSPEKLAYALQDILNFNQETWLEFKNILPVLINQYDIDNELKQNFITYLTSNQKMDLDDNFSKTYHAMISALSKKPCGTTLLSDVGMQLLKHRYETMYIRKEESEQLEFKKFTDALAERNGLLLYKINLRIEELSHELNGYLFCFSRRTKCRKIKLLNNLKELLSSNAELSFNEAISFLKDTTYLYLLFEGRTGNMIRQVKNCLSTRTDMIMLIQAEIDRLNQKNESIYFFAESRKRFLRSRINALDQLREKMTSPGMTVSDALDEMREGDESLLRNYDKPLLFELREIERAIPESFKDKRLIR